MPGVLGEKVGARIGELIAIVVLAALLLGLLRLAGSFGGLLTWIGVFSLLVSGLVIGVILVVDQVRPYCSKCGHNVEAYRSKRIFGKKKCRVHGDL
jgi:hypothetical protein